MNFSWGARSYVMGIINVTPDSFSGDGLLGVAEDAIEQARQFVAAGADILDIGGQSTRPGSELVGAEEEMKRVLPIIKAVRAAVSVPISIDTFYGSVAEAALDAGANWVNDVWGLQADERIASVVAERGCPVILMHNRSKRKELVYENRLGGQYVGATYDDLILDVKRELQMLADSALEKGIKKEQIILDVGIGFGKTVAQNCQLIAQLDQFKALGYPLLLGPSRKSFIGYTLDLPPNERVEGTAAAVAVGIFKGADIIRVHDVLEMVRVARMADALSIFALDAKQVIGN